MAHTPFLQGENIWDHEILRNCPFMLDLAYATVQNFFTCLNVQLIAQAPVLKP